MLCLGSTRGIVEGDDARNCSGLYIKLLLFKGVAMTAQFDIHH